MKEYFSWRRQILLIDRFWFENRKQFFYMIASTTALLTVWLGVFLSIQSPRLFSPQFQIAYYIIGLSVSGALIANFLFADLREKPKAINYLLLPASALEKIIVGFLFGVVVYGLAYTLVFYVVDTCMVSLCNRLLGSTWNVINIFSLGEYADPFFDEPADRLLLKYLALQALFVAGGLYFTRFSFFKTSLSFLGLWILRLLLPGIFLLVLPFGNFNHGLTSFEVLDLNGNKLVEMPDWFTWFFAAFFSVMIIPLLWVFAYFKLREKQIA
jgi:hypothetical protein